MQRHDGAGVREVIGLVKSYYSSGMYAILDYRFRPFVNNVELRYL